MDSTSAGTSSSSSSSNNQASSISNSVRTNRLANSGSSSSRNGGGGPEVLHVALGDLSCRISTLLHHIQGLSCTTTNEYDTYRENDRMSAATTMSTPTHSTFQNIHVPRTILVGQVMTTTTSAKDHHHHHHHDDRESATAMAATTWNGTVEVFSVAPPPLSSSLLRQRTTVSPPRPPPPSWNEGPDVSRYRVHGSIPSPVVSQYNTHQNERHVNWEEEIRHRNDDDDDDIDDDDAAAANEQERRRHWQRKEQIAYNVSMDDYWKSYYDTHNDDDDDDNIDSTAVVTDYNVPPLWTWYDDVHTGTTGPYHPTLTCVNVQDSPLAVPLLQQQQQQPATSSSLTDPNVPDHTTYYQAVREDTQFVDTILWEQHIRILLEQCDSCQGLMILQDNGDTGMSSTSHNMNPMNGMYTGWGTNLLQLWNEECPHTVQFSLPISSRSSSSSNSSTSSNPTNQEQGVDVRPTPHHQRHRVRDCVQQSLLLSDQTSLSTVVLPLHLPYVNKRNNQAAQAAALAMALECSTLPFRIVDGSGRQANVAHLALQSSYFSSIATNGTAGIPNLSYREFVRTLQRQSTSRNVLELDTTLPWNVSSSATSKSLLDLLQQGTSIERDHRMKQSGYQGGIHRPSEMRPGEWMNPSSRMDHSLLSSLSPQPTTTDKTIEQKQNAYDRDLHYHYMLSTSLRLPTSDSSTGSHHHNNRRSSDIQPSLSNYVTCIMESMGVRYRPEQSMCTVLNQSYDNLLCTNGSYWKYIFRGCDATSSTTTTIPSGHVSVLGNTTRIYPYLVRTASNAQQIVSPRNKKSVERSIYNHDITMGMVPEMDDYNEAVTTCLDLRDSYEPPHGSGLIVDEEGEYFDMS